jgi:hypothetical protein
VVHQHKGRIRSAAISGSCPRRWCGDGQYDRTSARAYRVTLDAQGDEQVKSTSLSPLFDCVSQISKECANYCDDEHQEMFWMAYQEIGLEDSPLGLVCMDSTENGYLSTAQAMNALVDRIQRLLNRQGAAMRCDLAAT